MLLSLFKASDCIDSCTKARYRVLCHHSNLYHPNFDPKSQEFFLPSSFSIFGDSFRSEAVAGCNALLLHARLHSQCSPSKKASTLSVLSSKWPLRIGMWAICTAGILKHGVFAHYLLLEVYNPCFQDSLELAYG